MIAPFFLVEVLIIFGVGLGDFVLVVSMATEDDETTTGILETFFVSSFESFGLV